MAKLPTPVPETAAGLASFDAAGRKIGAESPKFANREAMLRKLAEAMRRVTEGELFVNDLAGRCDAARKSWEVADDEEVEWSVGVVETPAERARKVLPALDRVHELVAEAFVAPPQRGQDQIVLGSEVVVERHLGDARLGQDLVDSGGVKAARAKQGQRGVEQMLATIGRHRCPRRNIQTRLYHKALILNINLFFSGSRIDRPRNSSLTI